jgi:2,3-bisphosphoglycerate-dependent phosphoglycerate mutase
MLWRRSYDTPPPPSPTTTSSASPPTRATRAARTSCARVRSASRTSSPDAALLVRRDRAGPAHGSTVLVAAHGNSLRALVKHLDGINDDDIAKLNIPTGIPLLYRLDAGLRPTVQGGEYLDPDAAADAIKAVANQGR